MSQRANIRTPTLVIAVAALLTLSGCAAETTGPSSTTSPPSSEHPTQAPEDAAMRAAEQAAERAATEAAERAAAEQEAAEAKPDLSQEELDHRLRSAAWSNDVATAAQLISWGADVNAQDDTSQSAYLIATSEGRLEFLRLTLEHGANVADLDSWVGTGLIRAAERGHWDIVGELLQTDISRDHVNRVGYQAIHEAVWFGRDDPSYFATTRMLIAGGVNFTTPSVSEGLTPLQMAEWKGYPKQAEILRQLGELPLPSDPNSALLEAAATGHANGVTMALRAGADPATVDAAGTSARELAAQGGHTVSEQLITAFGG